MHLTPAEKITDEMAAAGAAILDRHNSLIDDNEGLACAIYYAMEEARFARKADKDSNPCNAEELSDRSLRHSR
jgi:hypothetical protein